MIITIASTDSGRSRNPHMGKSTGICFVLCTISSKMSPKGVVNTSCPSADYWKALPRLPNISAPSLAQYARFCYSRQDSAFCSYSQESSLCNSLPQFFVTCNTCAMLTVTLSFAKVFLTRKEMCERYLTKCIKWV